MEEVEQVIKAYITHQFLFDDPDEDLDTEQPLISTGIVDSLGMFVLVAFIEERFGGKILAGDVRPENFETIRAIRRLVEARRPLPIHLQ